MISVPFLMMTLPSMFGHGPGCVVVVLLQVVMTS